MYIGKEPIVGNFQKCDAITVVNGQAAYTLQVSSTNVVPESSSHMLVSLNGILQAPVTSFTVSGSTLTFASNLATGDVIDFVILLGNVLDLGTPSDGTVTNAKLAQDIISGETALTAPPATTDEFLVSDAGTLKRIDFSLLGNTPAFSAVASGSQTISTATNTLLTFGTEIFDTDSAYDGTNKFTCPAGQGGKYFFRANIRLDSMYDEDEIQLSFFKNGSQDGTTVNFTRVPKDNISYAFGITGIIVLAATDYIQVNTYHTRGSDRTTTGAATAFSGFKLIGTQ